MASIPPNDLDYPDYKKTLGDAFLWAIKKTVPSAEKRHDYLIPFAKFSGLPGFRAREIPELEKTLHFQDKSTPITLKSPIMLAAGGNKTGMALSHFASLGFGGISVGSATPQPWLGNPYRPRVALIPKDRAMQNAMGLNNPGIEAIAKRVDLAIGRCHKHKMALGISVTETPGAAKGPKMVEDILFTLRKAYRIADYVEINVSCPNTGDDRLDIHTEFLKELLAEVKELRKSLVPRKAVFIKLSPDMNQVALDKTLDLLNQANITGVVLFNTFPANRAQFLNMKTPPDKLRVLSADGKKGGISGRILYQNTLPAVRFIKEQLPHFSVIASGGVDCGDKALELLEAGADAVQCYSVLAYRWNAIQKINQELFAALKAKGYKNAQSI
jgi:dihydroorotate dehydrogenase